MSKKKLSLPIGPEHFNRFWEQVKVQNGCWEWTRSLQHGYGQWKGRRAHRIAFTYVFGDIPEHLTVDHLCRNKQCVNPYHLDIVPIRINVLRSPIAVASMNNRKTHCSHGHIYSGKNLRFYRGQRVCRECFRIRDAERYKQFINSGSNSRDWKKSQKRRPYVELGIAQQSN